jgi:hypothetical protein
MTCNNINNIPPALIRPGRVDIISHLSYADDYQIELLFWKFFCPDVQDIPLEDIPKESLPVFANVATDILYSIRTSIMEYSKHEKMQIEISPAEITNFFLKHAIKFNLPNNPELVDECLQSLQDGVPDLVEGIVRSRKQARKHENDSSGSEERNEDLDDESSEEEL